MAAYPKDQSRAWGFVRGPAARALAVVALVAAGGLLSGCQEWAEWNDNQLKVAHDRWFNPSDVIRGPTRSSIRPILTSASMVDETTEMLPNAEPPSDVDFAYADTDYILGPTDVVQITVWDLLQEGREEVLTREITESGRIDLPLLESRLVVAGLTQQQLKDRVIDAYSRNVLRSPRVAVAILAKRNNRFSLIGAGRAGQYQLLGNNMRLLEALALAGGIPEHQTQYIYVFRPAALTPVGDAPEAGPLLPPAPPEALPELPPEVPPGTSVLGSAGSDLDTALGAHARPPVSLSHLRYAETAAGGSGGDDPAGTDDLPDPAPESSRFIFSGGRWIRVDGEDSPPPTAPTAPAAPTARGPAGPEQPDAPTAPPTADDPWGWNDAQPGDQMRIIAINYPALVNGEARYNIVVRNGDIIRIPSPPTGEFYLMGEIARPGVYTLTNRRVTIVQALAAGGNLGNLAWPENSYLIRRLEGNQQEIIPLDVEAIFRGERPDLFLKPDDVVAIGTNWRAPFLAVFRNAFRFSYGFGFLYDRNFSEAAPRGLDSRRFLVW